MSYKPLEITIISAKGLKRAKHLRSMIVYAAVTISAANPLSEQRTQADKDGGRNPYWNHTMKFTIDEAAAQMNYLALDIKLKCHRSLRGEKEIGEVHIPVKEFLDKAGDDCNSVKYMTYQVKKPSGKPKGELNLSYKFGDIPVTAYPAHVETSSPYPPPPPPVSLPPKMEAAVEAYPWPPACSGCNCSHNPAPATGHGNPPHGYSQHVARYPVHGGQPPLTPPPGYPTQASGYGYPPLVQPQQPLHDINGVGLVGLIGGMVGGLLIGEMMSVASDNDDAASE